MKHLLNFPVERYKGKLIKDNLPDFYDWMINKFKIEQERRRDWRNACMTAIGQGDKQKLVELQKEGRITLVYDYIDTLIDTFTRRDVKPEDLDFFINILLKGQDTYTDIEIEKDPKRLIIKGKGGKTIRAIQLTDVIPELNKDFLETEKRHGKCHGGALDISRAVSDPNCVATGYVYNFGEGAKFLHSWVEVNNSKKQLVVDTTRNLLIRRETYYDINHIDRFRVHRIARQEVFEDQDMFNYLIKKNSWLSKLYLCNRKQSMEAYRLLKSMENEGM